MTLHGGGNTRENGALSEVRFDAPGPPVSRREIERICMRNLLASREERMFFKDPDSRFILVSEGFLEGLCRGGALEDVVGKTDFDIFSKPHAIAAFEDEQHVIRTGQPILAKVERETFRDRPDVWVSTSKMPLLDDDGQIIGTFGISRDVTAQIAAQAALAHQALHDNVTGLANRVLLMDRLGQAIATLERQPGGVGLVFVDLDDFKSINDSLGHDVGDRVLSEIGRRLKQVARRSDTVGRVGGDEFVVLCIGLDEEHELERIAQRMMQAISAPFADKGRDATVTGSVGAIMTTDRAAQPAELLKQADIAMYAAKRSGRNRLQFYHPELAGATGLDRGLTLELRQAIASGQLFVVYQPVVSLDDGSVEGVEALARWRHPERGEIAPVEFLPLAEEHGLIGAIDEFVLNEACRQVGAWTSAGQCSEDFTIAVNLSGTELSELTLVSRVGAALVRHGIAPHRVHLEITENALIGELAAVNRTITALLQLGVRIALDDFGTGYSTLAHLQQLPAEILKIDRSFVANLDREPRDRKIVAAVIAMSHALGMTVVGEGVETEAQRSQLAQLGCDQAQGYLFAKPCQPAEIAEILAVGAPADAFVAAA